MESLFYYNDVMAANIGLDFKRALYDAIDWDQKMIAISGARGVGKTTLMLQRQITAIGLGSHSLYVSMDHPYFYNHNLFDLTDEFYKMGGRFLFIDEVHKYGQWSRELKVMYDVFPQLKVVFSASSALDIYRGEADLSRRVFTYSLPGMSFREFLSFKNKWSSTIFSLDDVLEKHRQLTNTMVANQELQVLPLFKEYLKNGYYPFSVNQQKEDYVIRLNQVINTILDTDMAYADGYTPATAIKLKKLLAVLAESVPFQPNVAELARKLGISRDSIYQYLKYLEKALLITSLHAKGKGISLLQKPEKIYLENTNLAYAITTEPDMGNIRETFVLNQLVNSKYEVYYPKEGDFMIEDKVVEVGGRQKKGKQIASIDKGYIAADDILTGAGNKIPLWLFGFLY
ncbi:ATP-binding protein [Olivibacter sitiensis]|uniref:ATP-binding protein n=1 Tax=Olivibacter sitiensis TaxID=376470 RepID=UPI0004228BDB|nr:ATP-binding protein [Olivibacter sitiensis]